MTSFFTDERKQKLRDLWPGVLTREQILKELLKLPGPPTDITLAYISQVACDMKLPARSTGRRAVKTQDSPNYPNNYRREPLPNYLVKCALVRGIGVAELTRRIMETVVADKMVDAILDDSPEVTSQLLATLVKESTVKTTAQKELDKLVQTRGRLPPAKFTPPALKTDPNASRGDNKDVLRQLLANAVKNTPRSA